jgi:hypothetical protein
MEEEGELMSVLVESSMGSLSVMDQRHDDGDASFSSSSSSPASSILPSSVLSVEVDAFLIGCLNNAKDRPFVLAVDDQLARLAITPLQMAASPSLDPTSMVPLVPTVDFPPLSSYHRRIVHRIAEHYGLAHRVFDLDHPQLAAMIPVNTTSKYRHVQVMHHPHTAPKSPQSLLRLRDLVPATPASPSSSPYAPPHVSRGSNGTGLPQGSPQQQPPWDANRSPPAASHVANGFSSAPPKSYIPMRRSPSPQLSSGVWSPSQPRSTFNPSNSYSGTSNTGDVDTDMALQNAAPAAAVQTPQPVGSVRLLQRKQPEPKSIKNPVVSAIITPGERPNATTLLGAPVDTALTGSSQASGIDAMTVGETSSALPALDSTAPIFDEDDDDCHIDERLRSQLRVREEEYAKARARIFGNSETAVVEDDADVFAIPATIPTPSHLHPTGDVAGGGDNPNQ